MVRTSRDTGHTATDGRASGRRHQGYEGPGLVDPDRARLGQSYHHARFEETEVIRLQRYRRGVLPLNRKAIKQL